MKSTKEFIYYFTLGAKFILTNHIFQGIIFTITFFIVSFVVYRSSILRKDVDKYEELTNKIEEKMETEIKINYQTTEEVPYLSGAASLSNCLKEPLTEDKFTENFTNTITAIENLFNSSKYNFAFKYEDIYTGFNISYNSGQPIFAASTIKAPEAIYIYEEAEKGNINLNDSITYTSNYYSEGTGILKNTPFNKSYDIKTLVSYSIIHSDNAAHLMLNNKYQSNNIYSYWNSLGTNVIFKDNNAWGNINADDATIYMKELYNYYISKNNYSDELLNYFIKAWKLIKVPDNNIVIANKTGWSGTSLHDAALIFDENPYILVILTNRGYTEYESFFNEASTLIYNLHKEYWTIKINSCL